MEDNFIECTVLPEETVKKVKQKMPEDGFIKVIFYSLDDEHIAEIVKKGSEHIEEL